MTRAERNAVAMRVVCPFCGRAVGHACARLNGTNRLRAWSFDPIRGGLIGAEDALYAHRDRYELAKRTR